jgi:hypothetical protein
LFGCGLEINSHICSLSGIPELREGMSHDARYLANSLTVVQQAFGDDAATIWVRRRGPSDVGLSWDWVPVRPSLRC